MLGKTIESVADRLKRFMKLAGVIKKRKTISGELNESVADRQ